MIVLKIIGWILLGILGLIAAVLVIAVIAMCFRVRFSVEYSAQNTSAVLKYLFLKIPLYPRPKKPKAEKKAKAVKEKAEEKTDLTEPLPEPVEQAEAAAQTAAEHDSSACEQQTESGAAQEETTAAQQPEKAPAKKKSGIKELLETLYNAEGIDGLTLIARRSCNYLGTFVGGLIGGVVVDDFDLDVRCTKSDAASTAIYYGEVCSVLFPLLASLAAKCKLKNQHINVYPDYIAKFSDASFALDFHITPLVMVGHVLALGIKFIFRVALQIIVKIFLYLKNGKKTGNDNKKIKGKSEVTNE